MAHDVTFIPADGTGPELTGGHPARARGHRGLYMLDHLAEPAAARALEHAIAAVIRKGDKVTYDLKLRRTDPSAVGTSQFADAVIEEMNA